MGTVRVVKRLSLTGLSLLLAVATAACSSSGVPWQSPGASVAPSGVAAASLAAGESPSSAAVSTAPTAAPTPEPTALPPFLNPDMALAVCAGTPQPNAAPLTGKLHPIVVADVSDPDYPRLNMDYAENTVYLADPVAYQAQLVACIGAASLIKVSYCGIYGLSSGAQGKVYRYKQQATIRVINAQTGKQWQAKTFTGKPASCKDQVLVSGDPPWKIVGGSISSDTIEAYLKSVSTIAVK